MTGIENFFGGFTGEDCEGVDGLSCLFIYPGVPDTGCGHEIMGGVLNGNIMSGIGSVIDGLYEVLNGNEAVMSFKGFSPGGFIEDFFDAGVIGGEFWFSYFGPRRHK